MNDPSMQFEQPPTDAELEFMSNAYHDDQGQGQQPQGGESSRGIRHELGVRQSQGTGF